MAYTITILHEFRVVYAKMTGVYDGDEARASDAEWQQLNRDGDFDTYNRLHDLTDVTEYKVSLTEIRQFAKYYSEIYERCHKKRLCRTLPRRFWYWSCLSGTGGPEIPGLPSVY